MITTGCTFNTTNWKGFKSFIEKHYKEIDDSKIEAVSKICFHFFKLVRFSSHNSLTINLKQREEMAEPIFKGGKCENLSSLDEYVRKIVANIFKTSFQIELEFLIYNRSTLGDFKLSWGENNAFIGKLPFPASPEVQVLNERKQQYEDAKLRILTDVTIKVDKTEFSAHKNILACCSKVFKAMFTSKMAEAQKSELDLSETPFITKESFEAYLEYSYIKTLPETISESTSQLINLLKLSNYFDYKELSDVCVFNLSKKINRRNIQRIAKVAEDLRRSDLKNVCNRYSPREEKRALLNRRVKPRTRYSCPDLGRCKFRISKTT